MKNKLQQIKSILKKIKKYRPYFIILAVIIVLVIIRMLIINKPEEKLTHTIHKSDLTETVKVTGTYTAASQTRVYSPTSGIITKLYVSDKDSVKKGDPLFHIESTATDEQKSLTYTAYQQAVTALQTAKQNKENTDVAMWAKQKAFLDAQNSLDFMNDQILEGKDNPSTKKSYTELEKESLKSAVTKADKEFRAVETQYKQSDQNISSAQALLNSTKLSFDATKSKTIYSPATGKIVNLLKNVGDGVSNQENSQPVLLVTNLENPSIIAKVSEIDVVRLKEDQEVQIIFDADKKTTFKGVVKAIDTVGTTTLGITNYDVRIELIDFSSSAIKPGMTAEINILTYSKKDVINVPNSAILSQNDQTFLKKADKKGELVKVDLGYQGLVKTEILGDLPDGLEILVITN